MYYDTVSIDEDNGCPFNKGFTLLLRKGTLSQITVGQVQMHALLSAERFKCRNIGNVNTVKKCLTNLTHNAEKHIITYHMSIKK